MCTMKVCICCAWLACSRTKCTEFAYIVELAAIIGREGRDVRAADAMDYVDGIFRKVSLLHATIVQILTI